MSENAEETILYPVEEACRRLGGISRANFYRRVADGRIRVVRLGRRTFVTAGEVARVICAASSGEA